MKSYLYHLVNQLVVQKLKKVGVVIQCKGINIFLSLRLEKAKANLRSSASFQELHI